MSLRSSLTAAAAVLALPLTLAPPALAAPPAPPPVAWIAQDGTTVTVDTAASAVRVRGCDVDTGWVEDPAMRTTGLVSGAVATDAGTLRYRLPVRGRAAGVATVGPQRVRGDVVTGTPDLIPGQAARLEELRGTLTSIIDASATNGGSVTVRDLSGRYGGQQLSVNGDAVYKAASVIKLQILVELLRQVECGAYALDDEILVTAADLVGGAGTLRSEGGFPKPVAIDRLAHLMVTVSDNSATNILIDRVGGFDAVNALNDTIGLDQAYLGRKMIAPANPALRQENYMTSDDMAATLAVIWDGTLLTPEHNAWILDTMRQQTVATKFKAALPPGTPLAHKTGELGDVSHDVGYILVPGHELSISVLTDGPRTPTGDQLVRDLTRAAYDELIAN